MLVPPLLPPPLSLTSRAFETHSGKKRGQRQRWRLPLSQLLRPPLSQSLRLPLQPDRW